MFYRSREHGCSGLYSEKGMQALYLHRVDHEEYPDFSGWIWDMLRSGVFRFADVA